MKHNHIKNGLASRHILPDSQAQRFATRRRLHKNDNTNKKSYVKYKYMREPRIRDNNLHPSTGF